MRVLGISAFYHDSAAALVTDGVITAAAQEERFTRKKYDAGFPYQAIAYCLAEAGIRLSDVDHVVFYEKPFLKFERLLETYMAYAPRGFLSFHESMSLWLKKKLFQKQFIGKALKEIEDGFDWKSRMLFVEHHFSHAASAFYPSPFQEAAILVMDGVGEWATTSAGMGRDHHIELHKEIHFPHSLGLLYSAFTYYLGFRVNSGEHKVMGLAPYGTPVYAQKILDTLIDLKADGSFRLDQSYFDYCTGPRMIHPRFAALFGESPRRHDAPLTVFHADMAASIQAVLDEAVLRMTRTLAVETGARRLCLAGGVALNCVTNSKLLRDGRFDDIWIQPAAGDAGGALGAALFAYHTVTHKPRRNIPGDAMAGGYLGPAYPTEDIARQLDVLGARYAVLEEDALLHTTAAALARGQVVGWMQGRMEFGPRALGARSILGDPRSPSMQKIMNMKIKYRESFRPFAPSVLREEAGEWFDMDHDNPYMLLVAHVKETHQQSLTPAEKNITGMDRLKLVYSDIPAVTHVDYSARLQTVHRETNPLYYALIEKFKAITGCPVLINTSFNVRGEPIVNTAEDAFRCFMGTEMDVLVAGSCLLRKEEQDSRLKLDYKNAFAPD